jgi:hypothetical protein
MQFAFHLEDVQLHDLADQVYRAAAHLDQHPAEAPYRLGKMPCAPVATMRPSVTFSRLCSAIPAWWMPCRDGPGLR